MNTKQFIVAIIFTLLISLAAGIQVDEVAKANFGPTPVSPPEITIIKPENASLQSGKVMLVFNVTHQWSWWKVVVNKVWFSYVLDNKPAVDMNPLMVYSVKTESTSVGSRNHSQWCITLSDLDSGVHNITIMGKIGETISDYAGDLGGAIGTSKPVYFTVDNTAPKISILSPENKTYKNTTIQLEWTTNEKTADSWYQLDNQANITCNRNVVLRSLFEGSHCVVIFANDTAGNVGKSVVTFFTVDTQLTSAPYLTPSEVSPIPTQPVSTVVTPLVPEFVMWVVIFLVAFISLLLLKQYGRSCCIE